MNTNTTTALVIEDNESIRLLIKDILSLKGVSALEYENPLTCLQALKERHYSNQCPCVDFLFTDNMMPNMTGLEFIKQLNVIGCKLPMQKMAIASGQWTTSDRALASDLGCKVFNKPFSIDEIHNWLDQIVNFS